MAKLIKRYLERHPTASTEEVWQKMKSKPLRGLDFMEARGERYVERGAKQVMGWRRFSNLVSEHRPKKV